MRSKNFTFRLRRNISPNALPPEGFRPRGFSLASAAGVACAAAAVATVAGESEDDEDGDDYPDKALVVVKKTAKAGVVHSRPPKSFLRILPPRYYIMSSRLGV